MDTARDRVFATEELFEGILSFLPFKKLFCIRKVSKRWAAGINGSASLQQKMFLRPRDQRELWILERKHRIGANRFKKEFKHLNDTEMKFRRVKIPPANTKIITPVTLNPMLQNNNYPDFPNSNIVRMAIGLESEVVTHVGWTEVFWDGESDGANASFWNTFLTDPPCNKVDVERFAFRLDDTAPPSNSRPSKRRPIVVASVNFPAQPPLTIESRAGVRMRDVLLRCLIARGCA